MGFGIPTITVVGEGISDGRSEAHAWNYVYIDGNWYGLDATFDDPIVRGGGSIQKKEKENFSWWVQQNLMVIIYQMV